MTAPTILNQALAELAQARRENVDLRAERDQWRTRALHDPLTGLLNRAGLTEEYDLHADPHLAVAIIDLDGFKEINDTLGHPTGDAVLADVADRLALRWRIAARLGGDEFVVIGYAPDLAELTARWTVWLPGGRALIVSGSVGVTGCVRSQELALGRADIAMLRAKAAGRGRTVRWDPVVDAEPVLGVRPARRRRDSRSAA